VLIREKIENYSGVNLNLDRCIRPLKKGFWCVDESVSVSGDAPKSFIGIYNYQKGSGIRKSNTKSWPRYIAKFGHKYYPLESINEYLFNRIGEILGIKMAESKLAMVSGQLRFLSRYFLKKDESLEHGAQIFAGYINDAEWIESIEKEGRAREFFTFQFAVLSIKSVFPKDWEPILLDFVRMLVFDAITGNNDRHFYNWGVIKDIQSRKKPIFTPVFDTARGLFWNTTEQNLVSKWWADPARLNEKIVKYANESKPKTGWEGLNDLNHFDLINNIFCSETRYKEICWQLINDENYEKIAKMIDSDFAWAFSDRRRNLIKECLRYRFIRLKEFTKKEI
jgi:hypothetical protein